MLYARLSTAIIVTVGPVLDSSGVAVTTAVVGDFKISKNGGAPAALNGSATLTHRNTGHYSLSLTTSDISAAGTAEVVIDATTNACPIKELTVLVAEVYDDLFGASAVGYLKPTVAGRDVDVSAGGEVGLDWANVGGQSTSVNLSATTVATAAAVTTVNGLAANVITAASINTGAITNAKFAAGAIDAAAIATDAIGSAEFSQAAADKVWGTAARTLTAATNITSTGGTTFTQTGDAFARLGAPVGASTSADIAAVKAQTAAIEADTQDLQNRVPAALVGGRIDATIDATGMEAGAVDQIWDEAVGDGALTARQVQRITIAAQGGKLSGAATTNVLIRDASDTKNVINATVDADGNRSAVTLNP